MLGFDAIGRLALGQLEDHTRNLTIEPGVFVLTGGNVQSQRLHADVGDFAVTGQSVTLKATRKVSVGAGAFVLSGQTVGLHRELRLAIGLGGFTFTGNTVDLSRFRPLVADPGSFALTGRSVTLRAVRAFSIAAGSFALAGKPVGLRGGRHLAIGTGTFSWTGVAVHLIAHRRLAISPIPPTYGASVGFAALGEVAIGQSDSRAAITFKLDGMTVLMRRGQIMAVGAAAFTATGQSTRLLAGDRAVTVSIRQSSSTNFKGRAGTKGVPAHVATAATSAGFKPRSSLERH